jgi:putative peptide zinc metalloprotease protein
MIFRGEHFRAIKDPIALKYFHLQPEQCLVLDCLDGKTSIEEIRSKVQKHFPMHYVTASDVQSLILDLHRKGLVLGMRAGQAKVLQKIANRQRWAKVKQTLLNPLFVKLPGWNPTRQLEVLDAMLGWAFSWQAIILSLLFVVASWIQLGVRYDDLRTKLPAFEQFFSWPNTVYLWLTIGLTKLVHEFGHGVACRRFGCQCHSIGVAFLVFSPTMYCDATDSWMLSNKWKRMAIAAAGMYVEVILSAFAIFCWSLLQPGLLENLCLNIFFVSTFSTVIFNANPLIKFDGYYILSDWMEIPNLREKAKTTVQDWIAKAFGLKPPRNPLLPKTNRVLYVLYSIAATAYSWTITVSIGIGMYQMLKPYKLESIGASIGLFVVSSTLIGLVRNGWKTVRTSRDEGVRHRRFWTTTLILGACSLAILFLPIPIHLRAPFVLEPKSLQTVTSVEPGTLQKIHVSVGDWVKRGQAIASVENEEIGDRISELRQELAKESSKLQVHHILQENDDYAVTQRTVFRIQQELSEWESVQKQLVIVSPCNGKIMAAARMPMPKKEMVQDQLSKWTGTPLASFNQGAFLEPGTTICEIGEEEAFDAVVLIDQHDRSDVAIGQKVRLLLEAFPFEVLDGRIIQISQRHLEFAPRNLSNKFGGDFATVTDAKGRERLNSNVYQIRIAVSEASSAYRLGMRGQAKVLVMERSAAQWIWRFIRQTFLFRL